MKPKENRYWLVKSEPSVYSIDDLKKDKKTAWTGIRNFTARNFMREMTSGDEVLFYHSSCPVPGVYGIAKVASKPYPDPTQFDTKNEYFDKRATKDKPVWDLVDLKYASTLKNPVPLADLKASKKLANMKMFKEWRLSVVSVSPAEFAEILKLGK